MAGEFKKTPESGTEVGRSPTGVPDSEMRPETESPPGTGSPGSTEAPEGIINRWARETLEKLGYKRPPVINTPRKEDHYDCPPDERVSRSGIPYSGSSPVRLSRSGIPCGAPPRRPPSGDGIIETFLRERREAQEKPAEAPPRGSGENGEKAPAPKAEGDSPAEPMPCAAQAASPIDDSPAICPEDPNPPASQQGGARGAPRLCGRRKGRRLVKPEEVSPKVLSPQERLLLLDTWRRSGLPAGDFAALVGLSKHTLYMWRHRFQELGPAGLMDRARGGPKGSRLPEVTRRTILMLKESNPDWGCQRISDMLLRGPALPASPAAVARVLKEAGYVLQEEPTRGHPDHPRRFERARPNQLWQTDLFTFVLKRQNRRVYLVAFMDDHSRFIVGYGLHATQSSALVIEVLRAAIASYQAPKEILTDNGAQYVTWRGKSAFSRELEKRGINHIVASPRRPQTLGKAERFWGSLWRECLEAAIFLDMADAQRRVGLYIDHHNFQRPHQGIDGLVPADRFFGAAPEVLRTLKERVARNSLDLARNGLPRAPFYLTGNAGGRSFSVHAEGERVILRREEGEREEIDLVGPERKEDPQPAGSPEAPGELPLPLCPNGSPADDAEHEEPPAPGTSPLDEAGALPGESPPEDPPEKGGEA